VASDGFESGRQEKLAKGYAAKKRAVRQGKNEVGFHVGSGGTGKKEKLKRAFVEFHKKKNARKSIKTKEDE